jgi:hypothetical protein
MCLKINRSGLQPMIDVYSMDLPWPFEMTSPEQSRRVGPTTVGHRQWQLGLKAV